MYVRCIYSVRVSGYFNSGCPPSALPFVVIHPGYSCLQGLDRLAGQEECSEPDVWTKEEISGKKTEVGG